MAKKGSLGMVGIFVLSIVFVACASAPPPERASKSGKTVAESSAKTDQGAAKSDARVKAQELITGESSASKSAADNGASAGANAVAATGTDTEAAPASIELTPREKQYFDNYLKRLKYMMVIKDGSPLDDFQKRNIITKGNEHLLRQGFDVVNYDQLVKNMEDQRTAWEAEAGESMSLIQYIAQKLGADVYVELEAAPRAWTEGAKHYAEANFTANMFDPSTAELLSSVTYRSDRSTDASQQAALLNALVASTARFMPRVVSDSTTVLRNRYSNGIRYQLIIQKTEDARAVAAFRRNIRSRVREIQSGPSSPDQTIMEVYLFGGLNDLEDACYAAFEKTPGMEDAYLLYTRGKTMTFNSGN